MIRTLPLALLLASPALAEPWACEFTVECVASETCSQSGYEVEILAADHEGQLFLSSMVGDTPIIRLSQPEAIPAAYASSGAHGPSEMITIHSDGSALMSAHIFDEGTMAVTYFGTCEAL